MEYLALVLDAFMSAFTWYMRIILADHGLWAVFSATLLVGAIVRLFVAPFYSASINLSAMDRAVSAKWKRKNANSSNSSYSSQKSGGN